MKIITLVVYLFSSISLAARLENVVILGGKQGTRNFELKIHAREGAPDSFFYLDISKSDPEAFDKLIHVIRKLTDPEGYRLDLDIPSFSVHPSGSYYRSEDINIFGVYGRAPNSNSSTTKVNTKRKEAPKIKK